jgi:hypothetical protein
VGGGEEERDGGGRARSPPQVFWFLVWCGLGRPRVQHNWLRFWTPPRSAIYLALLILLDFTDLASSNWLIWILL